MIVVTDETWLALCYHDGPPIEFRCGCVVKVEDEHPCIQRTCRGLQTQLDSMTVDERYINSLDDLKDMVAEKHLQDECPAEIVVAFRKKVWKPDQPNMCFEL
jgi:hypothetical protein